MNASTIMSILTIDEITNKPTNLAYGKSCCLAANIKQIRPTITSLNTSYIALKSTLV